MAALAQGHWLQASVSSLPQGHIQILARRHPPNTAKGDYSGPYAITSGASKLFQLNMRASWPMNSGIKCVLVHAWPSAGMLITDNTQHDVTGVYLWSKSLLTGIAAAAIVRPMPSSVTPCQR